jgi:4-alpha-glucanotransferase
MMQHVRCRQTYTALVVTTDSTHDTDHTSRYICSCTTMLRRSCACNDTGKFISKAAAEAAARSQARLLERAQAKLLSGGYNSEDGTTGGTNKDDGANVSPKGSDDVSYYYCY